ERAPGAGLRKKNRRGVAPGQELPSVRTWFAGDSRDGAARPAGAPGKRRGGKPGGARAGTSQGQASFAPANPYGGFGGGGHGSSHGHGSEARPGGRGRPQGQGGNRPPHGGGRPVGNRPH